MYGSQNKWCFVPRCTSTSTSTPNKIFVRVPQQYERKNRWFKAARRDMPKSKSEFFCCEDHFKLEEDMENYVRFKLMGGKILMKRDVDPHIFVCQPDRKRTATDGLKCSLPLKRERKCLVEEARAAHEQLVAQRLALDTPSTSTQEVQQESDIILEKQKSIGIQVRPSYRSKPETEGNDTFFIPAESIKQLTERDDNFEESLSANNIDDKSFNFIKIPREELNGDPFLVRTSQIKKEEIIEEDEVDQFSIKVESIENDEDLEGCESGFGIDNKRFDSVKNPREKEICDDEFSLRTSEIKQEEVIIKNEDEQNGEASNPIIHKCFHCGHQADNRDDLVQHIIVHAKPKRVPLLLKCFHCSYQTAQKRLLKLHVLRHLNPERMKKLKCDRCDYQSVRRTYLTRHINLHHNSEEVAKYICDKCDFKTFRKIRLTEHYLIHLKPEELTWYKCEQCDYQTVHKSYLTTHSLIHAKPGEAKTFKCDQCEYQAVRKNYLTKHYLVHQKPGDPRREEIKAAKSYACEQCNYQTIRKGDLAKHYGVHEKNRNVFMYKCVHCDFQTKSKHTVKRHIKTHKKNVGE